MMDVGVLCRQTISSKNTRATDSAVYGCPSGMKWAYLEKRSTTVRMTDLPPTLGSAVTKVVLTYCHTANRRKSDCRRLTGCRRSTLFRWQTAQARTKSWMNMLVFSTWKSWQSQ